MNHPWQQPIRPLEVLIPKTDMWATVMFVRPRSGGGWEVIDLFGNLWNDIEVDLRCPQAGE